MVYLFYVNPQADGQPVGGPAEQFLRCPRSSDRPFGGVFHCLGNVAKPGQRRSSLKRAVPALRAGPLQDIAAASEARGLRCGTALCSRYI